MASSLPGAGTQAMAGYVLGAAGYSGANFTSQFAAKGAARAATVTQMALRDMGIIGKNVGMRAGQQTAVNILKSGLVKELGFGGALKFATSKSGAPVALARGAFAGARALPVIGNAMLVYDLARMGGEIVKSGINLARDAEKSLQGSFSKPTFGMGYRDTEAAATSRSRGVMAIQNSRLNARSALGTEGAMMAAHFG